MDPNDRRVAFLAGRWLVTRERYEQAEMLLERPSGEALATYAVLGAVVGWLAVYVTRAVYWIEDLFEHLPIHWMWWPAIGAIGTRSGSGK